MTKLRRLWKRIPRKIRLPILILSIAALVLMLYTFAGSPTFSTEQEYRRAEKAHMVGPAVILGETELEMSSNYANMLIADDGDGIIFFCHDYTADLGNFDRSELIYREKTGDITVLSAPFSNDSREKTTLARLPVFVFDDYPDAVRAELDITLSTVYNGETFTKDYFLTSKRENPGYFQFHLTSNDPSGLGAEGYAIQVLTLISGYGGRSLTGTSIPVTVRLYDANDQLICDRSTEITSVVDQAHLEQEAG